MKLKLSIFLMIMSLLVGLILILSSLNSYRTKELKMDVIIGNHLGINLDTDAIHFGTVKQDRPYTLSREVTISNEGTTKQKIRLILEGELSEFIELSSEKFILYPQESKEIVVTLSINKDLSYGLHEGTIKTIIKEPII